jgi:two-component system, cell cycle sensor histidine kinase and response regulator CckA
MNSQRPSSVLIVEDERIVAADLQDTLRDLGYDAFAIASSAEEAIACASQRCPDVVLMDIRIRGTRDGIETAEILRRQFGVPVVYLTAHADDATVERAKRTEPYGYLLKPIKSAELRSAIEVCIYKHEMEQRLRERERFLSTTLESVTDAVVSIDLAGRVTFMNAVAEALTGVQAEAAVGQQAHDILRLMEETTPGSTLGGRTAAEPVHRRVGDGAAPVVHDGQTVGTVMVFRDVTEQRQLQKQLELSDRLASLGTMAAGVAHEINNPLAIVVANGSFIAEELAQLQAELHDSSAPATVAARFAETMLSLADLRTAADRIGGIVSELRAFSRPTPSASRGVVNVLHCLEWAVRTTSHEFRQRAQLITRFGEIPAVRADEAKLGQVFINLLVNAAHSIVPGGFDRNQVVIETCTDDRGWLVVAISDTGAGIPPNTISRIFEPFFTTKALGVGTGLGLSICHGIISALGGELLVESEPGKGTTFRVRLPPAPPETAASDLDVPQLTPPGLLRGRVLVIDDETMILRALQRVLRDHELVCAASAREALAIIAKDRRFDLIFADLMMPTMTGMEFYEVLLGREPELARRVIFLCGGALSAGSADFLGSVPNLQLPKPFNVAKLLETVQQQLARHADAASTARAGRAPP